jgi:opacity protein-like surface antigen
MKMMHVLAASLSFVAFDATAQEGSRTGFYLGASVGQPEHEFSKSKGMIIGISSPFGGGVFTVHPDDISVDNDDVSWKGTIGYRINRYVAAELSYADFGDGEVTERYTFDEPPVPFFPREITREYTANVSGPLVSVMGILPVGSQFEAFVRAGMLFADHNIKQDFQSGSDSHTFGSEVWVGGAGVGWRFASRWSARLEYLRTDTIDENLIVGSSEVDDFSLSVVFDL